MKSEFLGLIRLASRWLCVLGMQWGLVVGDEIKAPPVAAPAGLRLDLFKTLEDLARRETDPETRSQIAATARRLPVAQGLALVRELIAHDEDLGDPYIPPLCWWVLEHHIGANPERVLEFFEDRALWDRRIVFEHTLPRVMRRLASTGRRQDLVACGRLFALSPSPRHTAQLMRGFEDAFQGRPIPVLPDALNEALARANTNDGPRSLLIRLRQGNRDALAEALILVADMKARLEDRVRLVQGLGEIRATNAIVPLLQLATTDQPPELQRTALSALGAFDDPVIGDRVAKAASRFARDARTAAFALLVSRPKWCASLLKELESGTLAASLVPTEIADRLRSHPDSQLRESALRLLQRLTTAAADSSFSNRLASVEAALRSGPGNPYAGEALFMERCASCHKLFFKGGRVGPDLTNYQRDNLSTMLLSILNPNAEIREGYQASEIETNDDRVLTGFIADQDTQVVVLRGLDGQDVPLQRSEIRRVQPAGRSLMPEGLLDGLGDQQLKDFFAFLRSSQPFTR